MITRTVKKEWPVTEDDEHEGDNNISILWPHSHAAIHIRCRKLEIYTFATDVRKDKLTLAKPIALLPKIWLKVYKAWQLTLVVTLRAMVLRHLSPTCRVRKCADLHANEGKK